MKEYVTLVDDKVWRIAGTRVSLDSIVYAWNQGQSPERIRYSFPVLTLAEVYGALTFYLENKDMIDKYVAEGEANYMEAWQQQQTNTSDNPLFQKLRELKHKKGIGKNQPEAFAK